MLHRVPKICLACLATVLSLCLLIESQCPIGQFGPQCSYECHCDGICDAETGVCGGKCRNTADQKWAGPTCQLENKAYDKPVAQSSTARLRGHRYIASYAVDGKEGQELVDFTCTLTSKENNPWWRVDLGNYYYIQKIDVYNILEENYKSYLSGFKIYISNSTSEGAFKELCYSHSGESIGKNISVTCVKALSGQFVIVEQPVHDTLTLCEVEVYVCAGGSYGPECEHVCGHCVSGRPCHPITGECPDRLCAPGWDGPNCNKRCPGRSFGYQCLSMCGGCRANTTCDSVDGRCLDGCVDGRKTQFCNTTCPGGTCVERCGQCINSEPCDIKFNTGICENGCEPGWKTELCNVACPAGQYGKNCQSRCGNCVPGTVCKPDTGECPEGCQRGWVGSNCDIRDGPEEPLPGGSSNTNGGNKTGVIVGCVIAAIVILAVGLLLLLYYKRLVTPHFLHSSV
ncbi:multiple epidermal growth factor-like domains protein 10 [Liolophura sinensis]|uniref:multiple epidermal growth factor-like domains protein 10 n=1 Tax=Liolophura sinensis TaxID=3198878 RepID=UPI00315974C0